MISGQVLGCWLVLLFAATGAGAEAVSSCVVPLPQTAQTAPPPQQGKTVDDPLRRPMTEQELKDTIRFLELLRTSMGQTDIAAETRRLGDGRVGVVLGDVVALLGDLHARDLAAELDREAMTPQGLVWIEGMLEAMRRCAEKRFEGRGGLPEYTKSLELVRLFRAILENLVLEMVRLPRPGAPWPPSPGAAR